MDNVDPHGDTRNIFIKEEGIISGPMLCGVEMDRVNLSIQKVKATLWSKLQH